MDIHIGADTANSEERAAVDGVLGPPEVPLPSDSDQAATDWRNVRGGRAPAAERHLLLPVLHAVNDRIGWISPGALNYACQRLTIPPAEAFGVASFYALFSTRQRPRRVVHVCTDLACAALGAGAIVDGLNARSNSRQELNNDVCWQRSPCLGLCERAPAALAFEAGSHARAVVEAPVTEETLARLTAPPPLAQRGHEDVAVSVPQRGDPTLRLLRRVGVVDPVSIDDYRAHGGYEALRTAIALGQERTIREIVDSGLVGRGGAAFPTGRKWEAVARHPSRPHYLVCNADESEPGTFKDRVLLEGDPFAVVEAMTIAAFATGCERGFLYVRGEYAVAIDRLERAIEASRRRGLLGPNVTGAGFGFDIELRRGAGAYICGEETAIFQSIEGYRGEPRSKPPFPVDRGLFGKPTLVNNVETLVNVPLVLAGGGTAYAEQSADGATGTKLFCVSGSVGRPGVYEMPFGVTVRTLLEHAQTDVASLRAVLLGGAAGTFLTPDQFDLRLTLEATRNAGTTIGSGVVMAFDHTVDMAAVLLRIAAFFRDESCGQCVPCRVGTVRQEEALRRLLDRQPDGRQRYDLQILRDTGQVMRDASICGLGQTAWNAIESALDRLVTTDRVSGS